MKDLGIRGLGLGVMVALLSNSVAQGQLLPDQTLGGESSRIVPLGATVDQIQGGAIRGMNLFHSFEAFNVEAGRGVFFQNPEAIANILTRVTGGDPSRIFGTLGVLGDANLYLINPNGIIFGEQAQLDIRGSFFATTAASIPLGEEGLFSATQPEMSNLIAVDPGALFLNQLAQQSGIENRGRLQVGGDLTLAAGQLDLEGQLRAGGNLTLQGGEGLKIRDTVDQPFLAIAGRNLTLESQHIDIFALNHGESELVAGGDLVLRSPLPVLGDAHYFAGGNFRIEEPGGELGQLESPNDPVIRARGDVSMAGYTGISLHILAAGNVTIPGTITINGVDFFNGLTETVTLSDGSTLNIDGKNQPTLDIRAGMSLGAIASTNDPTGQATISNPDNPQGSHITLGTVTGAGGFSGDPIEVFLTNQYQANTDLPAGNITVNSISTSTGFFSFFSAGNITIDSRGNLNVTALNTDSVWENAGNVRLIAQGNTNIGTINASSGFSNAGSVNVIAQGDIAIAGLSDISSGFTTGGNLNLTAGGSGASQFGE